MKVAQQILTPSEVSKIQITPKFKNSLTAGANITIRCEVSAVGHKIVDQMFTLNNFNTIDVQKMLDDAGIKPAETASCFMYIYNNGVNISNHWLTIKP